MSRLNQEWKAIQKFVLASCLCVGGMSTIEAASLAHPQDQLFGPTQWREMGKQHVAGGDLLVLKSGRKLVGRLEQIPSLQYPFGSVNFTPRDVASLASGVIQGQSKLQVITQGGESFIADTPQQPLVFLERIHKSAGDRSVAGDRSNNHFASRQISPADINYLVLRDHAYRSSEETPKFFHVNFNNGDQLAVVLDPEDIHLTDGWQERTIRSDQLVEVSFNGGLQGCIEGEFCDEDLGFAFVKDPTLGMRLFSHDQSVRIPWDHIAGIKVDLGDYAADAQETTLAELYGEDHFDDGFEGELLTFSDVDEEEFEEGVATPIFAAVPENFEEEILVVESSAFDEVFAESEATVDFVDDVTFVETAFEPTPEPSTVVAMNDMDWGGDQSFHQRNDAFFNHDRAYEAQPQAVVASVDEMVFVPGGTFLVSVADGEAASSPAKGQLQGRSVANLLPTLGGPSEYIDVPGFYVDKHEVTNAQYAAFIRATGHRAPPHWFNGRVPEGLDHEPVVNVTYHDAETYAQWSGKRLPTELEWERASKEASTVLEASVVARNEVIQDQAFSILSLIANFEPVMADVDMPQITFGRVLNEISSRVAEWTASSAVADPASALGKVKNLYSQNRARYADHNVVRSGFVADLGDLHAPSRKHLSRDDFNSEIGFRCVTDAS